MALSYTQKTSDNSLIAKYVRKHYTSSFPLVGTHRVCEKKESLYSQFATYLVQNGLFMSSQLSADGFAGPLWNQTNLAVKVSRIFYWTAGHLRGHFQLMFSEVYCRP